jgi:ATP-binding cassette subfamily B protein
MTPEQSRVIRHIAGSYARHPRALTILVSATVAISVIDIVVPRFIKRLFDAFSHAETSAVMLQTVGIIAGLNLVGWLIGYVRKITGNNLRPRVSAEIQEAAFAKIIGHSYQFFSNTFAGALTKKVYRLGSSARTMAAEIEYVLLPIAVVVIGTAIVLWSVSPWLSVTFVVGMLACAVISHAVGVGKRAADKAAAKADTELGGLAADVFGNAITVKLFSADTQEIERISETGRRWAKLKSFANNRGTSISSAFALFSVVAQGALLAYCAIMLPRGELTIGDVAMLQTYAMLALGSIRGLESAMRNIDESLGDAAEAWELIEKPHGIQDGPAAKPLAIKDGAIAFRNVSFGYDPKRPVLRQFSLDIVPGEKVALIGPSGAGKSTVTKLLLRLVDVTKGTIRIDGQNIAKATQESLRNAVSLVPQDPSLFHRSLMDNIRYGRPDATDDEVIEAAKRARCHDFISALPDGYASLVGERGVKLSGGERQRVAIARAILKDAPILVLDEATSALDSESERAIHDALKELMAGKTVIAIAHRLSTIMGMDRIVVVEDGKIAATGTHDELLKDVGTYAKLWNIQAGSYK